ncbi:MAG TPA: GNAT family N-acetyltransferase [Tepidisphaeraceae bacterium]|jgi:predicted acetyltransferase|nr:GNAT family N-acetyltransferase [Tepidisphaeraceae bacterium]
MRWVGEEELDRVAETRWMCYAHANKELARFKEHLHADPWGGPGDYLLAERDGQAVGTATGLPFNLWVRGSPISCQGVAYVGTIKSARRRGGSEPGIASAVMHEILGKAREREQVVSLLAPFRASFYEHFGYGVVERRAQWTIPLSVLPAGECDGWRLSTPADHRAYCDQWQAAVVAGQCDIERSAGRWKYLRAREDDAMVFIDRPTSNGPVRGGAFIAQETVNDRRIVKVHEWSACSPDELVRLLSFLGTLRDQFSAAAITVQADVPVNRLLREPQVPHRPVDHPTPEVRCFTRMQARILDHKRFLESLHLPANGKGRVSVAIMETEGNVSRFALEFEAGRAQVTTASGTTGIECLDRHWAAIATGDLPASQAVRWGFARQNTAGAAEVLDILAAGPGPCCRESF